MGDERAIVKSNLWLRCADRVLLKMGEFKAELDAMSKNEFLEPAFGSAFTALFGALAYKYFVKDPHLVPVPLVLALLLQGLLNLGTSILIPVCSIVSILFAFWLFKTGGKLLKKK